MSEQSADLAARPCCDRCGEVIGVYEPIVLISSEGSPQRTSLAAMPDAEHRGRLLHGICYRAPTRP